VTIPSGVVRVESETFYHSSGLTTVSLANGITSIGDQAFLLCSSLASVIIPDSVTNIGTAEFAYCSGMTNVTIGNHLTSLSDSAFLNCSSLTSVTIPNNVTNIGADVFAYCGLRSVTIPNSVTGIGEYAFYRCAGLKSAAIGDHVTSIGSVAFAYCSGLTNLLLPSSVTSIGTNVFGNCTSLHRAYFQGNALSVNGWAGNLDSSMFSGESGTVYYLPGTTGWGATFGGWPTAPWYQSQPQILGPGYGLGVQINGFQFITSWATNTSVVVDASTNLQDWMPITTNALANGTNAFVDSTWTNYPQRFYRVRSQ